MDAFAFLCYYYLMQNTKVSVIIPVYNVEKYVSECIESVLAQSLNGVEIILVDDGSTDNSGQICSDYANKYPQNIKYIRKVNEGVSIARNTGLSYAKGEFVHFMDSDDTIDETFYENCYNIAKAENSNVVFIDKYFDKSDLKDMYSNTGWALFIRKAVLDENPLVRFPQGVQPAEDGIFVHKLTAVLNGDGYSLNDKNNYNYRIHCGGDHIRIKKNNDKLFIQIQKWLQTLAEFYDETGLASKRAFYIGRFLNREPLGRLLATDFTKEQAKILTDKIVEFFNTYVASKIVRGGGGTYKNLPLRLRVFIKTRNLMLTRFINSVLLFIFNLIPNRRLRKIIRWRLL